MSVKQICLNIILGSLYSIESLVEISIIQLKSDKSSFRSQSRNSGSATAHKAIKDQITNTGRLLDAPSYQRNGLFVLMYQFVGRNPIKLPYIFEPLSVYRSPSLVQVKNRLVALPILCLQVSSRVIVLSPNQHVFQLEPCLPLLLHEEIQCLCATEDVGCRIVLQYPKTLF